MHQKKCPQCKNLISAKAPTCLFCGRPNRFVTNDYVKTKWKKSSQKMTFFNRIYSKQSLFIITIILLIVIILNL